MCSAEQDSGLLYPAVPEKVSQTSTPLSVCSVFLQDLHSLLPLLLPDAQHGGVPGRAGLLLHLHLQAGRRDEQDGRLLLLPQHEGHLQGAGEPWPPGQGRGSAEQRPDRDWQVHHDLQSASSDLRTLLSDHNPHHMSCHHQPPVIHLYPWLQSFQ